MKLSREEFVLVPDAKKELDMAKRMVMSQGTTNLVFEYADIQDDLTLCMVFRFFVPAQGTECEMHFSVKEKGYKINFDSYGDNGDN